MLFKNKKTFDNLANCLSTWQDRLRTQFEDVLSNICPVAGGQMPVRMWEKGEVTFVEVDLPGVTKDNVEVSVNSDTLCVAATRSEIDGADQYNETYYGRCERTLTLPASVDPDTCRAELSNGVLKVSFDRREDSKIKKIEVK